MRNLNTLSLIDDSAERTYLIPDDIPAMEVIPATSGQPGLGPILRIPNGAEIECCDEGFNEKTVKVRWQGKFYFVFREDLPTQRKPTAKYACC